MKYRAIDVDAGHQNSGLGIVQEVEEWPSCPFAKMTPLGVHNFGKTTVGLPRFQTKKGILVLVTKICDWAKYYNRHFWSMPIIIFSPVGDQN